MQFDAILEVAIGLVMMWLILSVTTMEIRNWLSQVLNTRAKFLEGNLLEMFKNNKGFLERFYNHPAIKEMGKVDRKGNYKKPTYIPEDVFARVAMELLTTASKQGASAAPESISLSTMVDTLKQVKGLGPQLKDLMEHLFPGLEQAEEISAKIEKVQTKLKHFQDNVEKWFDRNLQNASGWYRENALNVAFAVGMGLAFPIDWASVPARTPSVWKGFFTITPEAKIAFRAGNECKVLVNVLAVNNIVGWILKLLGFTISAFAARQGAPFWFDLLKKLVSLRSATQPKKEEAKG